jgi:BASS family bile acid:Na+ symporter
MPIEGPIPAHVFTLFAAATIFAVMFDLGLNIAPGEYDLTWRRARLLLKALFAVLVAVPATAIIVAQALTLDRHVEIGIVLMALSPGAPVALRRSLDAGGEASFAPALQIAVASLAIVSMPLFIAGLNEYYGGQASISPRDLARQVFFAQLLPLSLGMLARRLLPGPAARLGPGLSRASKLLFLLLMVLALVQAGPVVLGAGTHVGLAIVLVTVLALAVGHALGGPAPETRTAAAIASAMRNPGLALVVATVNHAHPAVMATVLAYVVIAACTVLPYVFWRRRAAAAGAGG